MDVDKEMNVIIFFTYGISLKTWAESGLLQREVLVYQELRNKGVTVTFVTYGDEEDRNWEKELGGIKLVPVYENRAKPRSKLGQLLQSFTIPLFVKGILKEADLIKTNQVWGGWVPVLAKWLSGKPLLVRCGYEQYKNELQGGAPWYRRSATWAVSALTYRNGDKVLTTSENIASFIVKNFSTNAKDIVVNQNVIDTELFTPGKSLIEEPKKVLFVGRFSTEKNLFLLIEALSGTDIGLDLVGAGVLQKDLEAAAEKYGVEIRFLGRFPNDKMPELYRRYPVYVLCSQYEGNPKTLLEAMSCGCGVVGTDVPGIQDVIINELNGLLCPSEALSLRQAIVRLISDQKLRQKLGDAARKQICIKNSMSVLVEQELKLYKQIVVHC